MSLSILLTDNERYGKTCPLTSSLIRKSACVQSTNLKRTSPQTIRFGIDEITQSLSAFEQQLRLIKPRIHPSTKVFISSMAKQVQQSIIRTIQQQLGSVDCSLAKRRGSSYVR